MSSIAQREGAFLQLLNSRNETAVLLVDQFEELFTLCEDKTERGAFEQCLVNLLEGRTSS